jgi:hypothetical protein
LAAVANNFPRGPMYVSTKPGATRPSNNLQLQDWSSVASSAGGTRWVAATSGFSDRICGIYVSTSGGRRGMASDPATENEARRWGLRLGAGMSGSVAIREEKRS